MKLTWRDAAALPFMAAIIALYSAHVGGADGWFVSGVRGNATAILVLGTFGGCGFGSARDLFAGEHGTGVRLYTVAAAWLGVFALLGGVVALIAAREAALAVLFGATMALWILATARHLVAGAPPAATGSGAGGVRHAAR
jgi:hypothetical protein